MCRNWFFNLKVLPVKRFEGMAVISVGNASMGGTGKTPMAEYLVDRYQEKGFRVAYLSRGYKRQTQGFVEVNPEQHGAAEVGDEALQVARKFPDVRVAVCENRTKGVQALETTGDVDVLILDDAMQHRGIQRDLNLCMIDATRPPWKDWVVPVGRLREPFWMVKKRTDFFVLTHYPRRARKRSFIKHIDAQKTAYTRTQIQDIKLAWGQGETLKPEDIYARPMIVFAGLGNNRQFNDFLQEHGALIKRFYNFSDHHKYSANNIEMIVKRFRKERRKEVYKIPPIVLTTEKDYMRLKDAGLLTPQLNDIPIYYLEIALDFAGGKDKFDALADQIVQQHATRAQTGNISRDTGLYPETLSGAA